MIRSQNDMEQSQTNHGTLNHPPSHPPDLGSNTGMLNRKLKELEHKLDYMSILEHKHMHYGESMELQLLRIKMHVLKIKIEILKSLRRNHKEQK